MVSKNEVPKSSRKYKFIPKFIRRIFSNTKIKVAGRDETSTNAERKLGLFRS